MKIKSAYIFFSLLLFTSCNNIDLRNTWWVVLLFIALLLLSSGMFFYVARKKKNANNKLDTFSADVHKMLAQIETPEKKITALNLVLEQIENDEAYKKTPEWKNKVLSKIYEYQAAVYYSIGNEDSVLEACCRIIELDASNGMAYYNRGSMYSNQKEYEKALADFNEAIVLMPENSDVYNNRGLVYDSLGMCDKALSDYNYAINIEPSAIIYFNRASIYYECEKHIEAKQDYLQYLELDIDDSHKLREYAEAALQLIDKKQN